MKIPEEEFKCKSGWAFSGHVPLAAVGQSKPDTGQKRTSPLSRDIYSEMPTLPHGPPPAYLASLFHPQHPPWPGSSAYTEHAQSVFNTYHTLPLSGLVLGNMAPQNSLPWLPGLWGPQCLLLILSELCSDHFCFQVLYDPVQICP